jgi:hypothetical protein
VNSSVINKNVVHLKVSFLAVFFVFKFYEAVLKGFSTPGIFDDFTRFDGTESREDYFQIIISSDRIEFADEENILGRGHVCIREIPNHF